MVGNGLSTSPSTVAPQHRHTFPLVTVGDNVRLQARVSRSATHRPSTSIVLLDLLCIPDPLPLCATAQHHLLTRHLGVTSLALCYGYSMGGMQALHWAALYPAMVQRVAATCGTASCHEYNAVFLEGLLSILGPPTPAHAADGAPQGRPLPSPNLAAFGRVYAGWGLPDSWYRKQLWRQHGGHATLDAFLRDSWEKWTTNADADNMRCQLRTWRDAKLTQAQLAGITARVVYLPSPGDRYFTLPDVEAEARSIPGGLAQVVPLSMDWGHRAGDPHRAGQEADYERIRATVHALLRS